jgi:chromosome segregation ATPase
VDEGLKAMSRAAADLKLCQHEVERLRAELELCKVTIRRQTRQIRQLEGAMQQLEDELEEALRRPRRGRRT